MGVRAAVEGADLLEVLVGEDRRGERQLEGRLRSRLEEVRLRADRRLRRHDDLLADRVHGGIGHLGEELLEVVVEDLRALAEDGERGVVAHGADRVRPGRRHRVDDQADVLAAVAEDLLAPEHGLVVGLDDAAGGREVGDVDEVLAVPLRVRSGGGDGVLELVVGDDPALRRVHEEHPAGLEAALGDDVGRRDVEDAGFRGHDRRGRRGSRSSAPGGARCGRAWRRSGCRR